MAMVKFRELSQAADKLKTNGQAAAARYVTNAQAAAGTWQTNAAASEQNYQQGLQQSFARNAFSGGVNRSGAGRYSSQIGTNGNQRFSQGMGNAGPQWTKNFGAIASKVAGTDIGPRGPRGSQANKDRSSKMQDAFRAAAHAGA